MPNFQQRFDALLISSQLANQLIGKRSPGEVTYEESEQGDARRRLLHIEKLAAEQKASLERAQAEKLKVVELALHKRINNKLAETFTNSTQVAVSILGLSTDIAELLDTLATRACSVSKLEPIVCNLPWLQDAILKEINSPQNRRLDGKGQAIVIESIRTALSAIGIDNLRLLIPAQVFKHSVPQVTDPYPDIKHTLYEFSLGVANAMARLSSCLELKLYEAYTLGMLSNLGYCACTRQYFKEFYSEHNEFSKQVMNARQQSIYDALQLTQPSPDLLTNLYRTYSKELTTRSLEYLAFQRLHIVQAYVDKEQALNEALVLATKFARLKMLIRYHLVNREEATKALAQLKIPPAWFEVLNKPDLFKLNIEYS